MQWRNRWSIDQSNADGKPRRNGAKRRNILAKKIGAIFSSACGNRRTHRISLAIGEEEKRPVSEEHSSLSGIFRKTSTWKTIKTSSAKANGAKGPVKKAVRLIRKQDMRKKSTTRKEEKAHETEEGKIELCKKRILMGEKCRPLNQSGVLHYDKEGILLPEDVLPIEEA